MAEKTLTGKQERFIQEYIICLNGTEAARRAGYSGDNASLAVTASVTLRIPKVAARISEMLAIHAMSAAEVLVHLTDIARSDIADSLNSVGGIDPTEARRRGKSANIKRFKTKTTTMEDREIHETEIEMHDRLKALEILSKFHNLTNTVKIEDWRSQAIRDIQSGAIEFAALAQMFDETLALELFRAAGVNVLVSGE